MAKQLPLTDDLVARLGDPTDAGELALAATTLNDEADLLLTADRTDAATAVYREVVARFGGTSDPSVILQVRRAQRAGEEVSNSNGPRPTAAVPAEALIGIRRTIAGTAFDSLTDAELTEDVQAVCEPHADFDSVVANRAEQVNADPQGRDSIGYANALSAARALSCPDSVAS